MKIRQALENYDVKDTSDSTIMGCISSRTAPTSLVKPAAAPILSSTVASAGDNEPWTEIQRRSRVNHSESPSIFTSNSPLEFVEDEVAIAFLGNIQSPNIQAQTRIESWRAIRNKTRASKNLCGPQPARNLSEASYVEPINQRPDLPATTNDRPDSGYHLDTLFNQEQPSLENNLAASGTYSNPQEPRSPKRRPRSPMERPGSDNYIDSLSNGSRPNSADDRPGSGYYLEYLFDTQQPDCLSSERPRCLSSERPTSGGNSVLSENAGDTADLHVEGLPAGFSRVTKAADNRKYQKLAGNNKAATDNLPRYPTLNGGFCAPGLEPEKHNRSVVRGGPEKRREDAIGHNKEASSWPGLSDWMGPFSLEKMRSQISDVVLACHSVNIEPSWIATDRDRINYEYPI